MKRKTKVITTLMLSTFMLFSGVLGVQAETTSNEMICEDQSTLDLTKIYQLTNDKTENPEENFAFRVEKVSASKSQLTLDTMPSFAENLYQVHFAEGEATKEGKSNSTVVDLPVFTNVGVYTYRITEESGDTAGLIYDTEPVLLTVTVTNCGDGSDRLDRHYVMALENSPAEKVESFTNSFEAGGLTVEKEVSGILGDKNKEFHVDVEFTAPENKVVENTVYYTDNGAKSIGADEWKDGKVTASLTIKHGEKITFSNLPYGVTYKVSEVEANQDDYTTSITSTDNNQKIDSALDEVRIVNAKGGILPTGLSQNVLPYAVAASLIALLGLVFFFRQRQIRG